MFGKEDKVKIKVKLNPLFTQNKAKDVVTGIMFSQNEWVEIESSDWNRLKDKTWTLAGKAYPLLIEVDEEVPEEEDNDASDDYVGKDIEDFAKNGSVLQDTEVEEE
jgi:hypothetical protein